MMPFSHRLRVYWEDTDAGGVVFYANYLKFFERARTEWLRALGFSQRRLHDEEGALFIVTDTAVSYKRPARLDDEIDVSVDVMRLGGASIAIEQRAHRLPDDGGQASLLAEGTITVGCVDAGTFRPRRIPESIVAALSTMPRFDPDQPPAHRPETSSTA